MKLVVEHNCFLSSRLNKNEWKSFRRQEIQEKRIWIDFEFEKIWCKSITQLKWQFYANDLPRKDKTSGLRISGALSLKQFVWKFMLIRFFSLLLLFVSNCVIVLFIILNVIIVIIDSMAINKFSIKTRHDEKILPVLDYGFSDGWKNWFHKLLTWWILFP